MTIMGIVIAVVLLAFAITIANYKNNLTEVPPKLKASLIAMRFTNIPECFAYQDPETGRVYPGIIDLSKFTNEQMENCYPTQSTHEINFKLRLQNKGLEILTNNYVNNPAPGVPILPDFFMEENTLIPLVIPMEVLIRDGEEISGDVLEYEVQLGI